MIHRWKRPHIMRSAFFKSSRADIMAWYDMERNYIDVDARIKSNGDIRPFIIYFKGESYYISEVMDYMPFNTYQKGNPKGTPCYRYRCLINGKQKYLFHERTNEISGRWFLIKHFTDKEF